MPPKIWMACKTRHKINWPKKKSIQVVHVDLKLNDHCVKVCVFLSNKILQKFLVHVLTTDLLEGRQKCVNQKARNQFSLNSTFNNIWFTLKMSWVIQVYGNGKHDHFVANWVEFNFLNDQPLSYWAANSSETLF